jgi:two-component system, cell cycle response regulator
MGGNIKRVWGERKRREMKHDPARILCIEDDAVIRLAMQEALTDSGYIVQCVSDGPSGLAEYRREAFDLIIVDLWLPGMNGIEICRLFRRLAGPQFLPVILITGDASTKTKVEGLRAGASDFCLKPINLDELEARIQRLLELRERERRLRAESGRFRSLAFTDALTGLGNRRAFESELERAWARMTRSGRSLALLVADLDAFKPFNDRYGHRTGDAALRTMGDVLSKEIRRGDETFRLGGDEFAIIAPDANREGALVLADRVRKAIANAVIVPPLESSWSGPLSVTASIGFAVAPNAAILTRPGLVEAADHALYEAKATGHGNVVAWEPPAEKADPTPVPQ